MGVKLIAVAVVTFAYGTLSEVAKSYMVGHPLVISHAIGSVVACVALLVVLGARLLADFRFDIQGLSGTFAGAWALCAAAFSGLTASQVNWTNFGMIDLVVDVVFVVIASLLFALLVRYFFTSVNDR